MTELWRLDATELAQGIRTRRFSSREATAACLAIDEQVPAQELSYTRLRARLLADGQVIEWPRPAKP